MLDVVVRGTFQVGDHMRRNAVDGGDLGLLELARSDELRIFRRNGDAFVGHTALQQQRDVGVVQTDRLGDEVFLEPLVGFGLERRGILEDARHIAALIEKAFAVNLRRNREFEIVPMDGNRTLALIAVGREAPQVDDILVRKQLAGVQPVEEFIAVIEDRLDAGRMQKFQSHGTVVFIPEDARITVAPQGARYHQVVHQIEACGVGVGNLNKSVAWVVVLPLAAFICAAVKVHR